MFKFLRKLFHKNVEKPIESPCVPLSTDIHIEENSSPKPGPMPIEDMQIFIQYNTIYNPQLWE